MTLYFELDWQKSKDKEYGLFEANSMFRTAIHFFWNLILPHAQNMVQVIEGKII